MSQSQSKSHSPGFAMPSDASHTYPSQHDVENTRHNHLDSISKPALNELMQHIFLVTRESSLTPEDIINEYNRRMSTQEGMRAMVAIDQETTFRREREYDTSNGQAAYFPPSAELPPRVEGASDEMNDRRDLAHARRIRREEQEFRIQQERDRQAYVGRMITDAVAVPQDIITGPERTSADNRAITGGQALVEALKVPKTKEPQSLKERLPRTREVEI